MREPSTGSDSERIRDLTSRLRQNVRELGAKQAKLWQLEANKTVKDIKAQMVFLVMAAALAAIGAVKAFDALAFTVAQVNEWPAWSGQLISCVSALLLAAICGAVALYKGRHAKYEAKQMIRDARRLTHEEG